MSLAYVVRVVIVCGRATGHDALGDSATAYTLMRVSLAVAGRPTPRLEGFTRS